MVLGATGTGKTTLIDGMVNYILGVQWKDDFRYKLSVEDQHAFKCHSPTKGITAYTIYPTEDSAVPYTFTIIDTPGFDDSEGLKKDGTIIDQIKEFLSMSPPEGIDHLDGIGFVTQASTVRLTLKQEYVLDSILSIFGRDITKNIFIMLTFADCYCRPMPSSHEVISNVDVLSAKYFKFNNSALFSENSRKADDMFDEMFWKMGARSFRAFFAELENSQCISLHLTKEVWKQSEQVHTLIRELDQQITIASSKIDQLRHEERVLQQCTNEIQASKQFPFFTYAEQATKLRKSDPKQVEYSIKHLNEDIRVVEAQITAIKDQIQQGLRRLDEVALRPSPLMQYQYLERLIESEKMEARPGWQKRVFYYEEAKHHAEIWPHVKDVDVRQMMEGTPSNEVKW